MSFLTIRGPEALLGGGRFAEKQGEARQRDTPHQSYVLERCTHQCAKSRELALAHDARLAIYLVGALAGNGNCETPGLETEYFKGSRTDRSGSASSG